MKETKCPPKIKRLDKLHREILDRLLKDEGHLISPKYGLLKETHRPLSVKQVSFIFVTIFGCYISCFTLYRYLNWLEEEEKKDESITLPSIQERT
jgi:hypothetical protein